MIEYLKNQERQLQQSADSIKKTFFKPLYFHVEGINILLGRFWKHPAAELIWRKTIGMLKEVRKEIIEKEKKGV